MRPGRIVLSQPGHKHGYLNSIHMLRWDSPFKPCDDSVSFRKLNVFWKQKQASAICGTTQAEIEAPADGSLAIKTNSRKDTKALLKTTTFCNKQVTVSLHKGRNSCKGTIFAPELRHMSED